MLKSYLFLALFALSAVAFVGCDSNDEDEDYSAILGRWEALDDVDDDVYLDIGNDEIVVRFFEFENDPDIEPCFFTATLDVVSREGDEWTLRDEDGETETSTLRRDGDDLMIEFEGGLDARFERSTRTDFTPGCAF